MGKVSIIMVAGKSNNGKGEFSRHLEQLYHLFTSDNIIRCSLSTYIRDITRNDFYWDGVDTPESRKFMAEVYRLGTNIYPYHMARRVWERDILPKLKEDKDNIIILESFREKNNYDYFMKLNMLELIDKIVTVRVVRPNFDAVGSELKEHISEADLDDFEFDYEIVNDGDLNDLHKKTGKLFLKKLSLI